MATKQRMSNVQTVEQLYEAFNTGDTPTLLGAMAPDVEWVELEGSQFAGTFHGPDAVLMEVLRPCHKAFDPIEATPERFLEDGNVVVALGMFHAKTKDGRPIESPFAHVWELENGEISRLVNYTDTALWE